MNKYILSLLVIASALIAVSVVLAAGSGGERSGFSAPTEHAPAPESLNTVR